MKRFFLLFAVICIFSHNLSSQELLYPEIEKELNAEQKTIFDEAVKILQKASGNENNANAIDRKYAKKRDKPNWEEKTWEAKQQRIIAERNYELAYLMISNIYSGIISNAGYRSSSDESAALSLNSDAKNKFKSARGILAQYGNISKEVLITTSYEKVISDLKESHNKKIDGLRDQISALEIYERGEKKNEDNEDLAAWEKAKSANTIDSYYNYLNSNPRGKYMAQANDKIRELEKTSINDIATTTKNNKNSKYNRNTNKNEKRTNETNTYVNKATNESEIVTNNKNYETNSKTNNNVSLNSGKLVFKVQIAASTTAMSDWVLKHKAPGVDLIEEYRSRIWMRYMVGKFNSYNEAATFRDKLRNTAPDAFIVVFEKNKQIPVTAEMKK